MVATVTLTACAPLIIGGAAGTAVAVYSDRRPTDTQKHDRGLQMEISSELSKDYPNSNTEVSVWNGRVLIIGAVANQQQKNNITEKYSKHHDINKLYNEVNIGFNPALSTRGQDTILTTKLRTVFLATQGINSSSVKVTTDGSKVYLMGWVTQSELNKVLSTTEETEGVTEVINLMEVKN